MKSLISTFVIFTNAKFPLKYAEKLLFLLWFKN